VPLLFREVLEGLGARLSVTVIPADVTDPLPGGTGSADGDQLSITNRPVAVHGKAGL
jgi:hypothetical protein